MNNLTLRPIGKVCNNENGTYIKLDKNYIPALQALESFSHINVLWWFSDYDDAPSRAELQTEQPYKGAPSVVGIFATRSPIRPNPIALTTVEVIHIDLEEGLIQVAFIDANDNTPVLDIKPYTPSFDRVEAPSVPAWCSQWPKSTEESGYFDWSEVFNF
ncbi:SAM-dependent methyltransferase [Aminipila butyrica]|uniref:SAM-dependent methyltransferase n=1 Tax=Aminipila butyrica TaxID=433296 RepID=A0A858BXB4_9FIRM|nr:SAM-dependent methyltransferase [Aminipila butyrica]QIB70062.1 SAM-dependent methyltransferase [Aminipila butyrica]